MPENTLLYLPPITEKRAADGRLLLPRKFLDGVCEYARLWQGRIIVAMTASGGADWTLDTMAVRLDELPFEIQFLPADQVARRGLIRSARLVFAALVLRHIELADWCARENVPVVYDVDMAYIVRAAIIRADTRNALRRWRRLVWNRRLETRYRGALQRARGIQCNGTAAYEAYRALTPHSLFYLNTRVRRAMLATEQERAARRERIAAGQPLKLVFSGRLVAMKGVLDLPRVALALKQRGIRFTLDIFGSGDLGAELLKTIQMLNVSDCVNVRGEIPLPELVRQVADGSDLFVCCHPQGDPSTTFVETMSCGVPLIGYDTAGLRGAIQGAGAGWLTPCGMTEALAARIGALDQNRGELIHAAAQVFEFACEHTFEDVMRARITHLQMCAESVARSV